MLIEPFTATPTRPPSPSPDVLCANTPRAPSPSVPMELTAFTDTAAPAPAPLRLWAKTPSAPAPLVVMVPPPAVATVTAEAVWAPPARLWA